MTASFPMRRVDAPAGRGMKAQMLMTRTEAVGFKEASQLTGLSVRTLRRMNSVHEIGRQATPHAPIELSYPALVMLQHGDVEAVELLRAGRRDNPRVRQYLDLIGLGGPSHVATRV